MKPHTLPLVAFFGLAVAQTGIILGSYGFDFAGVSLALAGATAVIVAVTLAIRWRK